MAVIKWRDSYSTGVSQFDSEHRRMVELINGMFEAMRDKKELAEVEKMLEEVINYTQYHFANEEQAMAEIGYPGLAEHREEHDKLKEEAGSFKTRLKEDFDTGTKNFYHFLREWLTEHILECDMKYGKYLVDKKN
jgi:hemerythrin-like metal-binding protein